MHLAVSYGVGYICTVALNTVTDWISRNRAWNLLDIHGKELLDADTEVLLDP